MKNSQTKFVSVVIPTYNRGDYIAQSLDSVLTQKLPAGWQMEVIVVDDGSTDNTAKVLKKYKNKIKYIRLEHQGRPGPARNTAIRQAKGELIAFQDSDDVWQPGKLAKQLPVFANSKVVLCYGNAEVIEQDGQPTGESYLDTKAMKSGHVFKDLVKSNFVSTLTVVVRKSAIEKAGFFRELSKEYEDYVLWLKIAGLRLGHFKAIAEPLAYYRRHSTNFSNVTQIKAISNILAIFDHIWLAPYLIEADRLALEEAIANTHASWSRTMNEYSEDKPMISVVLSIYNSEKFLKPALESILSQTYKNFELIIIDDGSSDGSLDIIHQLDDKRIRIIHQTNHGLAKALDKGVRVARAPFIARMDADDISLPTRLEEEFSVLAANPKLALVGSFFAYIDEANSQPTGVIITSPTKSLDLRRTFYIRNPFAHGSIMYRYEAYDQAGGYRDSYGPTEDFDLWRRMSNHEWEFGQIPTILYLYRIRPTSISHQNQESQHKFTAKILAEQWRHKPFIFKGYRTIVRDGLYYRQLDSPFAAQIFDNYTQEQYVIAMEAFARGWFRTGMITSIAVGRLRPKLWLRLWRPAIGGFLRKAGAKEKKQ